MKVLGIIPARKGSKRVINKNIKLLNGSPLISYTINAANNSSLIDRYIISTDSTEIAEISKNYNAEVPFLRPSDLAEDKIPDKPVLQHALNWLNQNQNYKPDAVVLLRPTTPFKSGELINEVIEKFIEYGSDSVRTMTLVSGIQHPYWMYTKDGINKAMPIFNNIEIEKYHQSQLLPDIYRLNGVVDIIKTNVILNENLPLYGNDMRIHEISENLAHDIDTELDFEFCNFLMKKTLK